MKKLSSLLLVLSLTTSCAYIQNLIGDKPKEMTYLEKPKLDLKTFFNGDLESFAIMHDANGKTIGSYTAKIKGDWDDNKGVIKNNVYYTNGKKDNRTWLVTDNLDGTFDTVGHDVSDSETGKQIGNALQIAYILAVPQDGTKQKVKVKVENELYLVDENSMIGTSIVKSKDGKIISKSMVAVKKLSKN
ncbi:MAG: DUF3833 family protein [Proteobacteria bacterium]|nr:DUF3833 family protein [Pseudomonadota bacterium]